MSTYKNAISKTVNCPYCNKDLTITVIESGQITKQEKIITNIEIRGEVAICNHCNMLFTIDDIIETNRIRLQERIDSAIDDHRMESK